MRLGRYIAKKATISEWGEKKLVLKFYVCGSKVQLQFCDSITINVIYSWAGPVKKLPCCVLTKRGLQTLFEVTQRADDSSPVLVSSPAQTCASSTRSLRCSQKQKLSIFVGG